MCKNEEITWRKILYERQPFDDNYSGGEAKFLNELKKNLSAVKYTFREAVRACSHLMSHLNSLLLYFLLYEAVNEKVVDDVPLSCAFVVLCIIAFAFYLRIRSPQKFAYKEHLGSLITLVVVGYALTPIIKSLTTTISTDTIYALSIGFAVISCVFHDYGVRAPIVSEPVCISTGLSSAVLLVSRVSSPQSAFFLLSAAFVLHSMWPRMANLLFRVQPTVSLVLFVILSVCSIGCLFVYDPLLAVLWSGLQLFVVLLCPTILISIQYRKSTVHGPWDEAVPEFSTKKE